MSKIFSLERTWINRMDQLNNWGKNVKRNDRLLEIYIPKLSTW
jgi:hypothetical protein